MSSSDVPAAGVSVVLGYALKALESVFSAEDAVRDSGDSDRYADSGYVKEVLEEVVGVAEYVLACLPVEGSRSGDASEQSEEGVS